MKHLLPTAEVRNDTFGSGYSYFSQHLLSINSQIEPATCKSLWQSIASHYSESVRAYHTLNHLEQLFAQFEKVAHKLKQPHIIALALFYHDIIYDPTRADNERQSAIFFEQTYTSILPNALIKRICALIMLTATHELTDDVDDLDAAYLLDMDLSILGAEWSEYECYAQSVRQEYAHVATADYQNGRIAVLEGLLTHPKLYLTEDYYPRLERQARQNIKREIMALRAS